MEPITKCMDCSSTLPLKVCRSAADYYVGRFCDNCGPYSRESEEYYATEKEAQAAINNDDYTPRSHW